VESLGRHYFDFYYGDDYSYFPVDSIRFGLDFPEEWILRSFRLCDSENPEGDFSIPGSGLLFVLDECRLDERPFLSLTFNCTVPGALAIVEHPGTGDAAVHYCDYDFWEEDFYAGMRYVEVGDYCGWVPQEDPCTYCFKTRAGTFTPPSLEIFLDQGQHHVDTVEVNRSPCYNIVECGEYGPDDWCMEVVESGVQWASVLQIEEQGGTSTYQVTISADSLQGGEYRGRIWGYAGCEWCVSTCMELTLFVDQPSAIQPSTWGRIKSLVR
jgi:hypothetical protein